MASIEGKYKNDAFNSRMKEKQPTSTKKVPKQTPVASRSHSNVKKQPKSQEKGKGKATARKPYSWGYRIPNIHQDAMENVFQIARTMLVMKKIDEAPF
ncbi:hypothetical protein O181_031143 [Austropuccinia psidii MF-1]|uniref:Uncharacterized protein n=1 Tax=Austropuccinia psidii MF-1 TaxID=1389203 RepID=A0A9Q3CZ23_9BASI|nr:hypothetical protein [Austropuccinia psidii MF-1]